MRPQSALRIVSALTALTIPARQSASQSASPLRVAADTVQALNTTANDGGAWPDRSDATRIRRYEREDRALAMLRAIDRASLHDASDQLLYDNILEAVASSADSRICKSHLWTIVSQFNGWHVSAAGVARVQQIGTDGARAQALRLFRALPAAIATDQQILTAGLDSGYTVSRPVVEGVVRQIADLLPDDVTQSPLYAPATRDSSTAFRDEWRALLTNEIYPAARAFSAFLTTSYLPRARAAGSLSALPNGTACYRAVLRATTSVQSDLDSLMRDARRDVDYYTRLAAPYVRRLTNADDVARGIELLRTDPRFTFTNRDSILPAFSAMMTLAESRIGRAVANVPPAPIAVEPYPLFQERTGMPPSYVAAPSDGSRPARFSVNLSRGDRMSVGIAVAHEAYPGHHLQRIAAVRRTEIHPVLRSIGVGSFSEGWGIYAEELGGEMGLYRTALDSAGLYVHLLDVAVAAYLDVGFHAKGWSRDAIIDTMVVLGGRSRALAEAYAERHAGTPTQLASYYVGFRAIKTARARAERQLGTAFDPPAFNYEVIRDGSITLNSMNAKLDRWLANTMRVRGAGAP